MITTPCCTGECEIQRYKRLVEVSVCVRAFAHLVCTLNLERINLQKLQREHNGGCGKCLKSPSPSCSASLAPLHRITLSPSSPRHIIAFTIAISMQTSAALTVDLDKLTVDMVRLTRISRTVFGARLVVMFEFKRCRNHVYIYVHAYGSTDS